MSWIHPLDKKLGRDLWRLRGQALAIGLIIASGVGALSSSLSVVDALDATANAFYDRQHFGHVFARVKRAPRHLLHDIRALDGVQSAEARVVKWVTLDVHGFAEPVVGTLMSLPVGRLASVNRLRIRSGRRPTPDARHAVVLGEAFAAAHDLGPGDTLRALINGKQRTLDVVGTALSPEYVYAIGPGAMMPDPLRYGIGWLGEDVLASAFDLDGAFNDISLRLARGADVERVIHELDALLAPYGGTGAHAREDQLSYWFVANEIRQLRTMAAMLPTIFLLVAAFLANMVLARLIATERSETGLFKAFGYTSADVAWHYSKLVLAMAGGGILLGSMASWWLGWKVTAMYGELFRFPDLYYSPGWQPFLLAAVVSLAAALGGALTAALRAARLPPAEAMRPPSPASYRTGGFLSPVAQRWLDHLTRIIARQLLRWPVRALLTSLGVASSVAVLIMSFQWMDAISHMVDRAFFDQTRSDMTVSLVREQPLTVRSDFLRLPGVLAAEAHRAVPARLRAGHVSRREAVIGIPGDGQLHLLRAAQGKVVTVARYGLTLSDALAQRLGVAVGDEVTVEVLDGARPVVDLPVAAIFETLLGTPAYMHLDALNEALGDSPIVNTVLLKVDSARLDELYRALKTTPLVSAVTRRRAAVDNFNATIRENLFVFITIYVMFACTLAVGVVYNSLRIALSERGREMATLRVLGFHNGEVAYVLLGEAAVLVLLAMPLGCALGLWLVTAMSESFETELFRMPAYLEPSTYGTAMLIALATALACGALLARRVAALDLIRVLKTRE